MKRTVITLSAICALALGTFSSLQAQGPGPGGPHGRGHDGPGGDPLDKIAENLDLTDAQKAQVKPIVDAAKPQIIAIHQEAMEKTRAVIDAAAAQVRPLLTPEQQAKFDAFRKAHEDMRKAAQEMHEAQQK